MLGFSPKELIGRTYLLPPESDGQQFHAKNYKDIQRKRWWYFESSWSHLFLVTSTDSQHKEIATYNDIIAHIEKDFDESSNRTDRLYKFRDITAHQGPLISTDRSYKGSK